MFEILQEIKPSSFIRLDFKKSFSALVSISTSFEPYVKHFILKDKQKINATILL